MPARPDVAPLNLTAPILGDAPIGQPVSVDLGLWAPGTDLSADLLRDGQVIQTGLTGGAIAFTPVDDEASLVLRVVGLSADGQRSEEAFSAPVTARYAPPAVAPAHVPQDPEIYDEDTGPQFLDLGPAFTGDNLTFAAAGLTAATVDPATGILTTSTDTPIASGLVTVTAANSGGSASVTVEITVEDDGDMILTPTSMQTSVADPITGHVYAFVAADGVTPEAREVGQYQDGTWFVLGGAGDEVRIGSITPQSASVSTSAYTRPDNIDHAAVVGAQTRWMHGAMVNPWAGVAADTATFTGFDNYYGAAAQSAALAYRHDQNIDPGATGQALTLTTGSVIKAESVLGEGGHTAHPIDKTRLKRFSCLTVVPEIPAQNSFRPGPRALDKRSYWSADDLDLAGTRQIIPGFRPFSIADIDAATARIRHIQQTFMPFQEQARRINPGARGAGCDIYGDDWYYWFQFCFGAFHGDYADAEIEDLVKAVVQVGIDIYGLLQDDSYYFPWQAHHAGRKGIVFLAGLVLGDQDILDQCRWSDHPEHFGVDDAICGYVSQDMIGAQPRFYKGAYAYKWEPEHLGLAEWSNIFTEGRASPTKADVETEEQIVNAAILDRDYNVLSFDNGAMYQCLFGMISDPTAAYYNPAYFDFADRYLSLRFGDQIYGDYDISGDQASTNNVTIGNWWSINPSDQTVGFFQTMRNASARPSYIPQLRPEALQLPTVAHDGTSGHLVVTLKANTVISPRSADVPIIRYDLRWTAYVGGADTAPSENADNYLGTYDWKLIEGVAFPYNLTDVPRGEKVKVQVRAVNTNGPGPWLDDIKRENYAQNVATYAPLSGYRRYSRNFDVPDIAAFDKPPINFKAPSMLPPGAVATGALAMAVDGMWSENPAITATDYQWQVSDDGLTGWADISGATGAAFATTAAEQGKVLRVGARKSNSAGASDFVYSGAGVPVIQPPAIERNAGGAPAGVFDPGAGALGGKRLLILYSVFSRDPIALGGAVGAYAFGAAEAAYVDNTGNGGAQRFRQIAYLADIPAGETAETIAFAHGAGAHVAAYELTSAMRLLADDSNRSGLTTTVATALGGAAFWWGFSGGWVNFVSSPSLVEHSDNLPMDTSAIRAFAHVLGTGAGSVSVTHANQFDSNTRATLISLEPVA